MAELEQPDFSSPWAQLIGQRAAVELLQSSAPAPVHAYMFIGPEGVGKREAAKLFAAAILSDNFAAPDTERTLRLARNEQLVDLHIIEPQGRAFLVDDAERAMLAAAKPPAEKPRKVIVLDRFHTARPDVAPSLLKTIEEPPAKVVLLILSESVPKEHDTIASRCVKIPFAPLTAADIQTWLRSSAEFSLDEALVEQVADAALGSQRRARQLADDAGFADRLQLWQDAPQRCGTNGYNAVTMVEEWKRFVEVAQEKLVATQEAELDEQKARGEVLAVSAGEKKALEDKHKRELRQFREAELRWGFSVLAEAYWDKLQAAAEQNGDGGGGDNGSNNGGEDNDPEAQRKRIQALIARQERDQMPEICAQVLELLRDTQAELVRNPNESLMLQNLFRQLPHLP